MSAENNISSSMHKERLFFRSSSDSNCHKKRNYKKKLLVTDNHPQQLIIPPFSPTYCRPNEFPYSNFYVKLPNGKWMVRYRSGNRDILGTDEFEGYMI
ncbi:uncharacterized protein BX663DRAFT_456817 [Cokeromyces recurvatus]|uniref:uncharacterized protein n=1 Tax=Cokeromyces recurvatus TaxID=90255 RepID=UPI00221FFCAE|nr:uncharacterized protein BX663DRAFT_456817 [Cokeromyces recurvatus]KAI7901349.1 hypothetical protein BX663DRAFT_456817 [Cokeromyces recurvatus]